MKVTMRKGQKAVIWILAATMALPVVVLLAFFLYLHFETYDYVKTPAGYIRNERFVVGRYIECFANFESCHTILTVVDLESQCRAETVIFTLEGGPGSEVSAFTFRGSYSIRIDLRERFVDIRTYDVDLLKPKPIIVDLREQSK
jgi:hypothetical protein